MKIKSKVDAYRNAVDALNILSDYTKKSYPIGKYVMTNYGGAYVVSHNNHPVSISDANSVTVKFENGFEKEIEISEIY